MDRNTKSCLLWT